jgi:transcriptional regulator with XRE-family HTH domain
MHLGAAQDMTPLARWLWEELERRGLSAREAAIAAGLSHGSVSRFLSGRQASPASCRKLARYFDVPEEFVLHLAGHIKPPPDQDVFLKQMAQVTEGWTEDEKRTLVALARTLGRQREERH